MKTIFANLLLVMLTMAVSSMPLSAQATVTVTETTPPLRGSNVYVDKINGATDTPLLTFALKCDGADSVITEVHLVMSGEVCPTTLYVWDGKTLVASKAMSKEKWEVKLQKLDIRVIKGSTTILTIKGNFPPGSAPALTRCELIAVEYEKVSRRPTYARPPSKLLGPVQHLLGVAATWDINTKPKVTALKDENGKIKTIEVMYGFNVTARGGSIRKPGTPETKIVVEALHQEKPEIIICPSVAITIPNNDIADGSTAAVTVVANLPPGLVKEPGLYNFRIGSINWTSSDGMLIKQNWGLEDTWTPAVSYK